MTFQHLYFLADSATTATPQNGAGSPWSNLVPLALFCVIFYFLLIRPQMKKQKEEQHKQQEMIKSMKPGDKVITTGGIHGILLKVKDSTVTVKIAENVQIEVEKTAVVVLPKRTDDASAS